MINAKLISYNNYSLQKKVLVQQKTLSNNPNAGNTIRFSGNEGEGFWTKMTQWAVSYIPSTGVPPVDDAVKKSIKYLINDLIS